MNNTVWAFVMLWGVWLITPIVFDGLEALWRLLVLRSSPGRASESADDPPDEALPTVSIVVPAHNEEHVIDRCLCAVKAQDYPHDKLEVIIIDDGSTDRTAERVEDHVKGIDSGERPYTNGEFILRGRRIRVGPFQGEMALIKNGHGGKARALNAGIRASTGNLIVNIDCDVTLAPDAVRRIALAFYHDEDLGAITGNIEVDWELVPERDRQSHATVDEEGHPVPARLGALSWFLSRCQFLEYLAAFRLGRAAQSERGTIYTMAGACSGFRREILERGLLYSNTTVSEDTELTLDLHRSDVKIGFLPDVRVYVEPVLDWDALYAQRVRWTRGQLEVCGLNRDLIGGRDKGSFGRFTLPKMLVFDHTLAFPRLVWAPLILFFPLLGYSMGTIVKALVAMYLLYIVIETVNTLVCYHVAEEDTSSRVEHSGWALLGLPLYRFIVFHFRFSGFLVTLLEEQRWTMTGPVSQTRRDVHWVRVRSVDFLTGLFAATSATWVRLARFAQAVLAPLLLGIGFGAIIELWQNVRR